MTIEKGKRIWFPITWETGILDSVLTGDDDSVIAYIIERDDGTKIAIDMQIVEQSSDE